MKKRIHGNPYQSKGLFKVFKTQQDYQSWCDIMINIQLQLTMDAVVLALNQEFNFGAKRLKKFHDTFIEIYNHIVDMQNGDVSDKERLYSKQKLDEALLKAVGSENFVPYEKRYYG